MSDKNIDKRIYGYVMLPCFQVVIVGGECYMLCNKILCNIFDLFFAPFWTGKVHITEERG